MKLVHTKLSEKEYKRFLARKEELGISAYSLIKKLILAELEEADLPENSTDNEGASPLNCPRCGVLSKLRICRNCNWDRAKVVS